MGIVATVAVAGAYHFLLLGDAHRHQAVNEIVDLAVSLRDIPTITHHALSYHALRYHVWVHANHSCCPLRPRTTPFPEELSILGVIYGGVAPTSTIYDCTPKKQNLVFRLYDRGEPWGKPWMCTTRQRGALGKALDVHYSNPKEGQERTSDGTRVFAGQLQQGKRGGR